MRPRGTLPLFFCATFYGLHGHAEPLPAPQSTEQSVLNPFGFEKPAHTTGNAELGIAWLSFPTAEVCEEKACLSGDATPVIELWNVVRFDRRFALGAGVAIGLLATTKLPPSGTSITRSHSRSYFSVEGIARYYPDLFSFADFWIGGGLGLAVMSDTFDTEGNLDAFAPVGNPGITLKSEGLSTFGALGISQDFGKHWLGGLAARGGAYHFGAVPAQSPLGDVASISGTNGFVSLGLYFALKADL